MNLYWLMVGAMLGAAGYKVWDEHQRRLEALERQSLMRPSLEPSRAERRVALAQAQAFRDAGLYVGVERTERGPAER